MIPFIIKFAKKRNLMDSPNSRKVHKELIPALGGVAIWFSFLLSLIQIHEPYSLEILILAFCVSLIVCLGIIDDIKPQKALLKLLIQLIAAFLLVYFTEIKLSCLFGSFGINYLPIWLSIPLSVLIITTLVNAVNLIDGVNGLAASLGIFYFIFFGVYFHNNNQFHYVYICIGLISSLLAFLRYNLFKPSIFLGDTGSTLIGFVSAICLLKFFNQSLDSSSQIEFKAPYGLMLALFVIPIFDTFRVAFLRILKMRSPFSPDKSHIHHLFLRLNYKHYQITFLLIFINILIFLIAFYSQSLGDTLITIILLCLFFLGFILLDFFILKKFYMRADESIAIKKFQLFISNNWYLFFSVIVFVLPFQRWATSIPIIIFSLLWLFSIDIKKINYKSISLNSIFFTSILIYFVILYYSIYEFNWVHLFNSQSLKFILILFPFFLFFKKENYSLKKWYNILAFFVLGLVVFFGISFSIELIKHLALGNMSFDSIKQDYINISKINNIYFSLLINFGVLSCLYLKESHIIFLKNRLISFCIILFLVINLFLIQSKVGCFAFLMILLGYSLLNLKNMQKIYIEICLIFFTILVCGLFYFDASKLSYDYFFNSSFEVTKRITIWNDATALIYDKPFLGYGSQYLSILYLKSGLTLNCHNQFLELMLEYGIIGLLFYIIMLIYSLYYAVKSHEYFFIGFLFLIVYYSFFESILNTQTGIVFYSIFNSLFLLKVKFQLKREY